jgi:hypothetical protein
MSGGKRERRERRGKGKGKRTLMRQLALIDLIKGTGERERKGKGGKWQIGGKGGTRGEEKRGKEKEGEEEGEEEEDTSHQANASNEARSSS